MVASKAVLTVVSKELILAERLVGRWVQKSVELSDNEMAEAMGTMWVSRTAEE